MARPPMKLVGGTSNPKLWEDISRNLNIRMCSAEVKKFANSETSVKITETVRECDVFILQSGCGVVNDVCMETFILAQAARTASSHRVVAVLPYFPYSKQSKQKHRGCIPAKLIADLLKVAGVQQVLTLDLHHMQMEGFFSVTIDNVKASPLLIEAIKEHVPNWQKAVVAAKNTGASKRAALIAKRMGLDYCLLFGEQYTYAYNLAEERFSADGTYAGAGSETTNDEDRRELEMGVDDAAQGSDIIGDVSGRDVIIVDDVIDHAAPMIKAAQLFTTVGKARRVYVLATHGVFSGDSCAQLRSAPIEKVLVTNSIPQEEHVKQCDKIKVIDCSYVLAEAIRRIHFDESLYALYTTQRELRGVQLLRQGSVSARSRQTSVCKPDPSEDAADGPAAEPSS